MESRIHTVLESAELFHIFLRKGYFDMLSSYPRTPSLGSRMKGLIALQRIFEVDSPILKGNFEAMGSSVSSNSYKAE